MESDERRHRRRPGPQRDHETHRHHLAAGALHDVADRRFDDLVDDVGGEEAVRRVDQLILDRRQGVRPEQRRDVGQAAEHPQQEGGNDNAHQNAACADSEKMESSQLFDNVRRVMCQMWWRDGGTGSGWPVMTSQALLTKRAPAQAGGVETAPPEADQASAVLISSTAASSTSLASCSLAWCWQKSSSAPEGSFARTRAAAPQRSQRSALVSSGLVRVAFMAPPSSALRISAKAPRLRMSTLSDVLDSGLVPQGFTGVSCLTWPPCCWPGKLTVCIHRRVSWFTCAAPTDWLTAQRSGEHRPDSLERAGLRPPLGS